MTSQTFPALRCRCGKPARPWRGSGAMPQTCEECRKRDADEARALYEWKRREARKDHPRALSQHPRAVKGRRLRAAMLERSGWVRCACGRMMPRLAQDGTERQRCKVCRPKAGVQAMLEARGIRATRRAA